MIDWAQSTSRSARTSALVLWGAAGFLMLAAHVSVAALLMRDPPPVPASASPPPAIMMELAEIAQAVDTTETDIQPEMEDLEAATPAEKVETSEVTPPEEVAELQPEPVEQAVEAEIEPAQIAEAEPLEPVMEDVVEQEIVEDVVEMLDENEIILPDEVEVPLFAQRPTAAPRPAPERKDPPKPTEAKKPAPRQQLQQAASKLTNKAKAQVEKSSRNAARQSASGVSSSVSPARWQSRLMAHLERRKRYPAGARKRGEQGIVHVRFRIDDAGNVLSVILAGSSGFRELDDEVIAMVQRASPVPAPPPGVSKTITAPVKFSARR